MTSWLGQNFKTHVCKSIKHVMHKKVAMTHIKIMEKWRVWSFGVGLWIGLCQFYWLRNDVWCRSAHDNKKKLWIKTEGIESIFWEKSGWSRGGCFRGVVAGPVGHWPIRVLKMSTHRMRRVVKGNLVLV